MKWRDVTPSYTVDSDVTVKDFSVMRFGKIVMVNFYFKLAAAKANNTDILIADSLPRPAGYCAQAAVVDAVNSIRGAVAIFYESPIYKRIRCNGQLNNGNYLITQLIYLTTE